MKEINLDLLNARETVEELRDWLLNSRKHSDVPPRYEDWTDVIDRIYYLIERHDLQLVHLIALGMSPKCDPMEERAPTNWLCSFCKGIQRERDIIRNRELV